ncbi:DNA/RNA-binding protein KIN17 [Pteropus vampyrus]|uniref:DNA/RNA-binding protein KIN17 n=1 Tax=Pteropus vampyrus TaxID=132908 RepID=A0A6P6CFE9_PTEVA|nr:DNA/RNA-binding protein KIN17 [Pteropus vampyrus]
MGKSDFLTPKAIANRIKSKGLQKLRWYCQMCQKQCRDENGFKCHCMSESHQRQLLLASENPQQFMDYFSEEFRNDFLELLRRRFGTKRVHNNIVYNEYISHREHIHMNATQWETLTDFTKWLGREGEHETYLNSGHVVPWQGGKSCHGCYVNLCKKGWAGN